MHHSVKFAVKCHHSKGGMSASACNLDSSIYILDLRGKKGFVEIIFIFLKIRYRKNHFGASTETEVSPLLSSPTVRLSLTDGLFRDQTCRPDLNPNSPDLQSCRAC